MKKIILILFVGGFLLSSCEGSKDPVSCDCDLVNYESNPGNNYVWTETARLSWDASCKDKIISEVTTTLSGKKYHSRSEVECD